MASRHQSPTPCMHNEDCDLAILVSGHATRSLHWCTPLEVDEGSEGSSSTSDTRELLVSEDPGGMVPCAKTACWAKTSERNINIGNRINGTRECTLTSIIDRIAETDLRQIPAISHKCGIQLVRGGTLRHARHIIGNMRICWTG